MRTRPTCHPTGEIRLKMMITVTVKAAWPATNPMALAAYDARKIAIGIAIHMSTGSLPASTAKRPPAAKPMTLPASACTVVRPVASAFERSTESVPSTTQNAWPRPSVRASSTEIASPTATRRCRGAPSSSARGGCAASAPVRSATPRAPSRCGMVPAGSDTPLVGRSPPAAITAFVLSAMVRYAMTRSV